MQRNNEPPNYITVGNMAKRV